MNKAYLSGGIYAEYNPDVEMLKLYLDIGLGPTNIIWMDAIAYDALEQYVKRVVMEEK